MTVTTERTNQPIVLLRVKGELLQARRQETVFTGVAVNKP